MQDLSGSKVRMRHLTKTSQMLERDEEFVLSTHSLDEDVRGATLTVPELVSVIEPGDLVLLADGAIRMQALSRTEQAVRCKVLVGGRIKAHQAVHVPGKAPAVRVPTEKDREDAFFGIQHDVDWIALSYGTTGDEVEDLRTFIRQQGSDIPVVAKIERRAALDHLDEMIGAADAVMVARGDLGLEIPVEEVALVQKDIIHRAVAAHRPVITATEMLASMMEQPRPTRAEVADITNAILDGSDALMLSGETAIGEHPVEAVKFMARVASVTDARRAQMHSANGSHA